MKPESAEQTPAVTKPRDGFTTGLGVIAATLGSAIGLGNIWKFPTLTGLNGGAAFIVVYLACTLLVGLPVMISELALGRRARADAVTTFEKLAPRTAKGRSEPWWLVGAMGALAAFLILAFYTEVAAWVFAYIFKAAFGSLNLYDFATLNLLLPVGGLFICLFVGWRWAHPDVEATLSNEGALRNRRFISLFLALVKFVTPVLVFVVLLNGLGVIKL